MSYAKNSKIEASDFNGLVGSSTTSTDGQLNAILGPGNGSKGYGQTVVPEVLANNQVVYNDWANLVNKTSTVASHQGTAITAVTVPVQGVRIDYTSAIPTNLTSITSSRLNAAAQGTTSSTTTSAGSTWASQLTFTHTVTFSSGDAARYFFNAGGQLALTFSSPSGSGINALMNSLGTACGTIIMSAQSSGSITIASTSYNGITKVGGSGTATTLATNTGYYGLTTTNIEIFKQFASGTPSGYVNSFISVNARSNGTQGSKGDNGSVITFTTVWDEVPNGLTVSAGTATTLTVRPPSTSYISNTWGTPTVVGSVTGS